MPAPDAPPGLRIGSLRGVPIYLGRSWFVIALVVIALFGPQVALVLPGIGAAAFLVALGYVLLLLLSVLVHEAAHALAAQARGYQVQAIVADLWGGHTSYRAVSGSPGSTAIVAVVGPLSNLLLAGIGWLLLPASQSDIGSLLLAAFTYANAFVGVFNLLPGLPLDGGHLVDAAVWRVTGSRAKGIRAAGWSGRVMVVLVVLWLVVLPMLRGNSPSLTSVLWTLLVAGFLWQGASAAVASGSDMELLGSVSVGDLVRPVAFARVDAPIDQLDTRDYVGVDEAGAPAGFASMEDIRHAREVSPQAPLASVIRRQPPEWVVPVTGPQEDVTDLVRAVNSTPVHLDALLVVDPQGHPLGIVSVRALDQALQHVSRTARRR